MRTCKFTDATYVKNSPRVLGKTLEEQCRGDRDQQRKVRRAS